MFANMNSTAMEGDHCRCTVVRKGTVGQANWARMVGEEDRFAQGVIPTVSSASARADVVALMRHVQAHFRYSEKCLHRAVRMLDQICGSPTCRVGPDVALLGLTCLYVVAKNTESTCSQPYQLLKVAKLRFSVADFLAMERRVINQMLHGVSAPDATDFVRSLFAACGEVAPEPTAEAVPAASTTVAYTGERPNGHVPASGLEVAGFKVKPETPVRVLFASVAAKFDVSTVMDSLSLYLLEKNACGVYTARFIVAAYGCAEETTASDMGITPGCELLCTPDVSRNFLLYNSREKRGVPYLPNRSFFRCAEGFMSASVLHPLYAQLSPSELASLTAGVAMIATEHDPQAAADHIVAMEERLSSADSRRNISLLLERHAEEFAKASGEYLPLGALERVVEKLRQSGSADITSLPPLLPLLVAEDDVASMYDDATSSDPCTSSFASALHTPKSSLDDDESEMSHRSALPPLHLGRCASLSESVMVSQSSSKSSSRTWSLQKVFRGAAVLR